MNTSLLIGLVAAGVVTAIVLAGLWLWRRRRRGSLAEVLRGIRIAAQTDVTVPDGNGGLIHLEHLIFTAKGLVVLDVKTVSGIVFASDSMAEWTAIAKRGRFTFRNPQPALLDRIAAVKLIARDIPVTGYVVFLGDPRIVVISSISPE